MEEAVVNLGVVVVELMNLGVKMEVVVEAVVALAVLADDYTDCTD